MDFISIFGKPLQEDVVKQWELELGLAKRSSQEDRVYYEFKQGGVSINVDAESMRPTMITFYREPGKFWDGQPFTKPLPLGVRFGMSRDELHQLFGAPTDSRAAWDKWDRGDVVVRAGYESGGKGPMMSFYLLGA